MTFADRLLLALAPRTAHWAVRALAATLTITEVGAEHVAPFWERRAPLIYAIWHGRILMIPCLYGRPNRVRVMASRSRDGELEARFLTRFGFEMVRGSSTRGGAAALRSLVECLKRGLEAAVAPDGPLGPPYVVQPGVIALARLSGVPIVPLTFSAAPAWRLRSWDEFLIPKPFAHGVVSFGPPLHVPRDRDRAEHEALRKQLESTLRELTWQADARAQAR
ncbi:MAG: lysophospholipid acyltransferase family protein [Candidatus Rokubacteria bacterium]|nr:lysophospholipid acyltransferase family protein [Candidatus Rokubacteria bacterium]